eukprot:CAMPEP_0113667220 /NCGR_PEP_ID=MMETSP0038_2-20120614/3314_1 /TAXON_ID=2898 /ORGANISM="Cryptomonas paramecium" /LENGTH=139 /DNA_ID=CAMNT_0000582809 /DNA_START=520 /DNA_END=943 /DNA_ORIENTATION=+ /assembly_acc=CAM_ASM_000170
MTVSMDPLQWNQAPNLKPSDLGVSPIMIVDPSSKVGGDCILPQLPGPKCVTATSSQFVYTIPASCPSPAAAPEAAMAAPGPLAQARPAMCCAWKVQSPRWRPNQSRPADRYPYQIPRSCASANMSNASEVKRESVSSLR